MPHRRHNTQILAENLISDRSMSLAWGTRRNTVISIRLCAPNTQLTNARFAKTKLDDARPQTGGDCAQTPKRARVWAAQVPKGIDSLGNCAGFCLCIVVSNAAVNGGRDKISTDSRRIWAGRCDGRQGCRVLGARAVASCAVEVDPDELCVQERCL